MNIYVSSGAFLMRYLPEMLAQCDQYQLNLELGPAVAYTPDLGEIIACLGRSRRLLVHNYFPPPLEPFVLNLASTDSVIWQMSIAQCRRAIDLCLELGAPFYSVHAGFAMHLLPEDLGNPAAQRGLMRQRMIPRAEAYACFLRSIRLLAQYANERQIALLIENNVTTRDNLDEQGESPLLLSYPEEICQFFEEVKGVGVRLLLDVGHAKVTAKTKEEPPERFFEQLTPYIEALHLSENDGLWDSNQKFDHTAWFAPYLPQFYDKSIVIEVYRLSVEQLLAQHRCLLKMLNESGDMT